VYVGVALSLLLCTACSKTTAVKNVLPGLVQQFGVEEDRWDDMEMAAWVDLLPHIKTYTLQHPNDPSAHFMLGRCFRHLPRFQLTIAEGEFSTALHLFQSRGTPGGLTSIFTADEFEAAIHRELALINLRWAREAMVSGIPPRLYQPSLQKAMEHVEEGLQLNPKSQKLVDLAEMLKAILTPATVNFQNSRGRNV
jgi:hypothetical protein